MSTPLGAFGTYRHGTVQNVAYAAAGGASAASSAFGAQTYAIRVSVSGAITATSGVRINVGVSNSEVSAFGP